MTNDVLDAAVSQILQENAQLRWRLAVAEATLADLAKAEKAAEAAAKDPVEEASSE